MLDFPRWKQAWLWTITLVFAAAALPSIFSVAGLPWPSALPAPRVNLGLDLAGGSHILLEANTDQVRRQRLETMADDVRARLKSAENPIRIGDISTKDGSVSFMVADPTKVDAARELLQTLTSGAQLTGQRDWDLSVVNGNTIVLRPTDAGINQAVTQAMDTATEVVRKRIDALGTREPTIIRQGSDRIVVQVPGLKDPTALKNLLGQTAKLEFKLVDDSALASDIQQGIILPGDELVPFLDPAKDGAIPLAVRRLGGIKGDQLANAQQGFDDRNNSPIVNITFDQQGGAKFARLTTENVGKRFAIVLDGKVLSAPVIQEPIIGGQARISGSFTVQTANQLAISLRSGALPVDLKVVEERSVGPDLGADSIHKGMIAMAVGTLTVVLFILLTYGRFGLYADIALVFNVLMILGVMAIMNTTLTLPVLPGSTGAAVIL